MRPVTSPRTASFFRSPITRTSESPKLRVACQQEKRLTSSLTGFRFWSVKRTNLKREKKECILSAATRLFARFGFKKTSVDQIAKDAGVAKGTVYLAADTKEDLFYQAVHRELRAYTA